MLGPSLRMKKNESIPLPLTQMLEYIKMSTSVSFLLIGVKLPMYAGTLIFSKIKIDSILNFIYHSFFYILGFGRRERRTR